MSVARVPASEKSPLGIWVTLRAPRVGEPAEVLGTFSSWGAVASYVLEQATSKVLEESLIAVAKLFELTLHPYPGKRWHAELCVGLEYRLSVAWALVELGALTPAMLSELQEFEYFEQPENGQLRTAELFFRAFSAKLGLKPESFDVLQRVRDEVKVRFSTEPTVPPHTPQLSQLVLTFKQGSLTLASWQHYPLP